MGKIRPISLERERMVLCYLLLSKEVLGRIERCFSADWFNDRFNQLAAEWCIEHFQEFGEAPGANFSAIFLEKAQDTDDDTLENWERKCKKLDEDLERFAANDSEFFNPATAIKFVATFVNERWAERKSEKEAEAVRERDYETFYKLREEQPPKLDDFFGQSITDGADVANKIIDEFYKESVVLFQLPGALGELINDELTRKSFVMFMGHAKVGKTWTLLEIMYRATMRRLNVLFVAIGDMTEAQVYKRLLKRVKGMPTSAERCKKFYTEVFPDCSLNRSACCPLKDKDEQIEWSEDMTQEEAVEAGYIPCFDCFKDRENQRHKGMLPVAYFSEPKALEKADREDEMKALKSAARGGKIWFRYTKLPLTFRIISCGKNDMTPGKLKRGLQDLKRTLNWKPDVIVLDYFDNMGSDGNEKEERHKSNAIAGGLRKLALDEDVLIVTATQTNREGFKSTNVAEHQIGEDKRKLDHITALITISSSSEDKRERMVRYSKPISRETEIEEGWDVGCFRNLALGRQMVKTFWMRKRQEKYNPKN